MQWAVKVRVEEKVFQKVLGSELGVCSEQLQCHGLGWAIGTNTASVRW